MNYYMPSQTVEFSDNEDNMVELFKTVFKNKTKPDAIREMVKIAFQTKHGVIMKAVKKLKES